MNPSHVSGTLLLHGTALLLVACQKGKGPMQKLWKKADETAKPAADKAQGTAGMVGGNIEQTGGNLEQSANR